MKLIVLVVIWLGCSILTYLFGCYLTRNERVWTKGDRDLQIFLSLMTGPIGILIMFIEFIVMLGSNDEPSNW